MMLHLINHYIGVLPSFERLFYTKKIIIDKLIITIDLESANGTSTEFIYWGSITNHDSVW